MNPDCHVCGPSDDIDDAKPLSSHDYVTILPLEKADIRVYDDKVVADRHYRWSSLRVSATMARSEFMLGMVTGTLFFLGLALVFLYLYVASGSSVSLFFVLMFAAFGIYVLALLIKLEREAARNTSRQDIPEK